MRRKHPLRTVARCIALAALWPAANAFADPLAELYLQGRNVTNGDAVFSSVISGDAGDVLELQLSTVLAAIGSQNVQGTTTRTITSKQDGVDGITTIRFHVYDPIGDLVDVDLPTAFTFINGWADGATNAGTVSGPVGNSDNGLHRVNPGQAIGVYVAANAQSIIGNTTTNLVSITGPGSIRLGINQPINHNASSILSIRINGGQTAAGTTTIEAGTDPMVRFHDLAVVPEPSAIAAGAIALGWFGVQRRRVRR